MTKADFKKKNIDFCPKANYLIHSDKSIFDTIKKTQIAPHQIKNNKICPTIPTKRTEFYRVKNTIKKITKYHGTQQVPYKFKTSTGQVQDKLTTQN